MAVTFEIITQPIGSQFVRSVYSSIPADTNDFTCYILSSENSTGLEQSDLTLSNGSIQSFEGSGCCYKVVIRPEVTSSSPTFHTITLTIAANAVTEGNSVTTKTIRLSKSFPDADAEAPTRLFVVPISLFGMTASPDRIIGYRNRPGFTSYANLEFFTYAGVHQTAETWEVLNTFQRRLAYISIGFINGDVLVGGLGNSLENYAVYRLDIQANTAQIVTPQMYLASVTHSKLGITGIRNTIGRGTQIIEATLVAERLAENVRLPVAFTTIAADGDLLYFIRRSASFGMGVAEITSDTEAKFLRRLNIDFRAQDIAIYRDTLYLLRRSPNEIHTLDIKKYRPMAKSTKTTIYPVFIKNGQTLDLTELAPDAERIVFDVGYAKPSWLSINASNALVVAANATTDVQPVLVKCRAINRIDSAPFQFYLIIEANTAPVWRDFTDLTLKQNGSYDLRGVVDTDTIIFKPGETQPVGASLSNGVLRMGTVSGTVKLRATRGSLHTDKDIEVDLVAVASPANFSDVFRYTVEIAGISLPAADVLQSGRNPHISKSLDSIQLTRYRAHSVGIDLVDEDGKYNPDIENNFWDTHNLNPGGYQESIKVFLENYVNNAWVKTLMFVGIIEDQVEVISNVQVHLTANDVSVELERTQVSGFGTLEKWDAVRRQSDEETSFEGVYVPEGSLLPMQVEDSEAWTDQTKLTRQTLQLPTQGPPLENTMYLSAQDMRVAGGFLGVPPLLKFKAYPRSEDVRFLIQQLAVARKIYNTEIQLPAVTLKNPSIFNRGSVPFSTEKTRITRLPTDWDYDATQKRLLILMSNIETHIADQLVQYDLETDDFRVLYTFAKNTKAHRITRRSSTLYSILTSEGIIENRSAATGPRQREDTGYAFDSRAAGSAIKIYEYNTTANTLTERVSNTNAYRPQLGIHYWVGFETKLRADEFEGIRPDFRGTFKWVGSYLYYRYAKDKEFGVARMNASGTVERLIHETDLDLQNHLNFAFDVTSGGVVYFAYMTQETDFSTFTIKRRAADGTIATLLTDRRIVGSVVAKDRSFAAWLGCHEALFHNNFLYVLCPLQAVSDAGLLTRSNLTPTVRVTADGRISGGNRVSFARVNPSNATLSVGDNIQVRFILDAGSSRTFNVPSASDINITNGTFVSITRNNERTFDLTIRPANLQAHQNIEIHITQIIQSTNVVRNRDARIFVDFGIEGSRTTTAGMGLYRCNVTAGTPTLTSLEKYDFVHQGACNLTVHDSAVHFVEQSTAAAQFKTYNPDFTETYNEQLGYNVIPESQGALKKVSAAGALEPLGNLWYAERSWNRARTRMLSIGDDLHLTMGYGNTEELLRYNSLASKADNFTHLVYGRTLEFIIPTFIPAQNIYAALSELARQVGATLAFDGGLITVADRRAFRAKLMGPSGTGVANRVSFKDANKTFPVRGYFRAGQEFIAYTGITSGAFTGIQRGELGTDIINHPDDTPILYLHALLSDRDVQGMRVRTDTARHFNVIRDPAMQFEVRDDDSIAEYNTQPYPLNLGLTRNENAWVQTIFAEYLSELKDLGRGLDLTLVASKKTNALELGQTIGLEYGPLRYVARIEAIVYGEDAVRVQAKTLPFETPTFGTIASQAFNEDGSRVINFTYTDTALQGNTTGVVKFYETATSTTPITTIPGTSDAITSDSVVFNANGQGVATVTLPATETDTTIYAELEVTKDMATITSNRFKADIKNAIAAAISTIAMQTLAEGGTRTIEFDYTEGQPTIRGTATGTAAFFAAASGGTAIAPDSQGRILIPGETAKYITAVAVNFTNDAGSVAGMKKGTLTLTVPDLDQDRTVYIEVSATQPDN